MNTEENNAQLPQSSVMRWVSVKDALPENNKPFLIECFFIFIKHI